MAEKGVLSLPLNHVGNFEGEGTGREEGVRKKGTAEAPNPLFLFAEGVKDGRSYPKKKRTKKQNDRLLSFPSRLKKGDGERD